MKRDPQKPLSLAPLTFDEAITDILKIKPEPNPPKSRLKATAKKQKGQRKMNPK